MMLHFDMKEMAANAAMALQADQDNGAYRVMPRRPRSLTMREAVAVAQGGLQPLGEDMKNIFADIFDTPDRGERTYSASDLRAMLARKRLMKRPAAAPVTEETAAPEDAPRESPAAFGSDQLASLRQSLDADDAPAAETAEPRASLPMFMAIHAMNLVLLVVFAPLGLALTLYALIKGPDLRLTANSLVMTGLLLSFGQITSMAMA